MGLFNFTNVNMSLEVGQQQQSYFADIGYFAQDYNVTDYAEENPTYETAVNHQITLSQESDVFLETRETEMQNFATIDIEPPVLVIDLNTYGG